MSAPELAGACLRGESWTGSSGGTGRVGTAMARAYRKGAIGALLDLYERATSGLLRQLRSVKPDEFETVLDPLQEDEDCRSIQTVLRHVIRSGYGYADAVRKAFQQATEQAEDALPPLGEVIPRLKAMMVYTEKTFAGKWEMSAQEVTRTVVKTRWGSTYHVEQLLEHAIVHVLRHRRQIERILEELRGGGP